MAILLRVMVPLFICAAVAISSVIDMMLVDDSADASSLQSIYVQSDGSPRMGREFENIFWIVQISDLHISKFRDRKRGPDLLNFCKTYLSLIDPQFVIVTGDLVDAKMVDNYGSTQFEEEWKEYQAIVTECQKIGQAKWLDLRGNHDAFDVPELDSERNYYRYYSIQGTTHPTSYLFNYYAPYGKYSFIGVDACPDPGPRRPFNFFGLLNDDRMEELAHYAEDSLDSNHTIWFGHYPTSIIVHDPPALRSVMRKGIAYLCGHLHTLGGIVPQMYTRQKTGTLELELGDWRDNRIFRVLAVDHDLLSFVDHSLGEWPIILITNPKHALFQSPNQEPLERMKSSSHIRLLVFAPKEVKSVHIFIDGSFIGRAQTNCCQFYTLPWQPEKYLTGLHTIRVVIKDRKGRKDEISQPFSLDGTKPSFRMLPRLILMMNITAVGKSIFVFLVIFHIVLLTSLRQCTNIRALYFKSRYRIPHFFNRWMWKLWLTSTNNVTYFLLSGFLMYVTFGPWFVGNMLAEDNGYVFVWGLFIKDAFIPGSHTYFYGIFQLVTFNFPLLFFISHELDVLSRRSGQPRRFLCVRRLIEIDVPFVLLLLFQASVALTEFPRAYGTKAVLLGPVRTGSIVFAIVLQVLVVKHLGRVRTLNQNNSSCPEEESPMSNFKFSAS